MHQSTPAFNFEQTYILEDDFVRLSPLKKTHQKSLQYITDDPEIWTYFFEKGANKEQLIHYIQTALENRSLGKEYPFVVYDKVKKAYAGTTRLYEFSSDLSTIKLGHTWYGKTFRGTGLNKHCKFLLFEFIFDQIGLERIGFGSYKENEISIAAMKSVGCKEEGMLRGMFPALNRKGRTDAILLSILRKEWQSYGKTALSKKLHQTSKNN